MMNPLAKTLRARVRLLAAPHFMVTGVEKWSNTSLRLIFSGPEEHLAYLDNRIFAPGTAQTKALGRHSLHSLTRLLARNQCQIGIAVGAKKSLNRNIEASDLLLPLWVECSVDLNREQLASPSRDVKRSVTRFHREGFSYGISNRADDVTSFFSQIYLPTIQKSHGSAALPASLEERLMQVESGTAELLQVFEGGRCVAGLIIDFRQCTPALKEIGVLGGSERLKRHGLIPSMNYFAFHHLHEKGYDRASLGLSRSFLDDGVLQFKRKFRPTVCGVSEDSILIRIIELGDSIRAMLCNSPLFSYSNDQLVRTFFQDSDLQTRLSDGKNSFLDWDFGVSAMQCIDLSTRTLFHPVQAGSSASSSTR